MKPGWRFCLTSCVCARLLEHATWTCHCDPCRAGACFLGAPELPWRRLLVGKGGRVSRGRCLLQCPGHWSQMLGTPSLAGQASLTKDLESQYHTQNLGW